jgi:hypothetical protein
MEKAQNVPLNQIGYLLSPLLLMMTQKVLDRAKMLSNWLLMKCSSKQQWGPFAHPLGRPWPEFRAAGPAMCGEMGPLHVADRGKQFDDPARSWHRTALRPGSSTPWQEMLVNDEWIKKWWCLCVMGYYLTLKMRKYWHVYHLDKSKIIMHSRSQTQVSLCDTLLGFSRGAELIGWTKRQVGR